MKTWNVKTKNLPEGFWSKLVWDLESMCWRITASPSRIPWSFKVLRLSSRGIPLKAITISEAGKPDSISQKALKFSNSSSSDTSSTNIKSVRVVTVTFILVFFSLRPNLVREKKSTNHVFENDKLKNCQITVGYFGSDASFFVVFFHCLHRHRPFQNKNSTLFIERTSEFFTNAF